MFKRILWVELVARFCFGLGEVIHWQLANLTIEGLSLRDVLLSAWKWEDAGSEMVPRTGADKLSKRVSLVQTCSPCFQPKLAKSNLPSDGIRYLTEMINWISKPILIVVVHPCRRKKPPNVGFATQCSVDVAVFPRKVAVTKTCLEDMKTWMSERLRASIDIEKNKKWTTSQGT